MKIAKNIIIRPNPRDLSNDIVFDEVEKVYSNLNRETKHFGLIESIKKLFSSGKNGNGSQNYISEGESINTSQLEGILATMKFQPIDPSEAIFSYIGIHGKNVVYLCQNKAMVFVPPELVRVDKYDLTQEGTTYFYNKIKLKI